MTVYQTAGEPRTPWRARTMGALSAAAIAAAMLLGVSAQAAGVTLQQAAIDSTKTFQMNLWGLSYYSGAITGKASTALTQAGQAFQRDNCINPSGQLGPQTTAALRAKVKEVQVKVKATPADGVYGAKTKAAVSTWQKANGLQGLGMFGVKSMAKAGITRTKKCGGTTNPGSALRSKIVSIARAQVGISEPKGCMKFGNCKIAWCAIFAGWTWRSAGVKPVFTTAVARGVGLWGKQRGLFRSTPRIGDVAVYGPPANVVGGHVAVVVAVHSNGTIDTVDGNFGNKVTLRKNVNPKTARSGTKRWLISGYVTPPGA
jgi:peptidoglycan hydrolase-like protein with peptidoglycan-binding domain